jgi:hypothetical protein
MSQHDTFPKERSALASGLFAVASLLLRCSLAVILSFMPTARQGFCGEPDIVG